MKYSEVTGKSGKRSSKVTGTEYTFFKNTDDFSGISFLPTAIDHSLKHHSYLTCTNVLSRNLFKVRKT
jgi:hypothetical protein